LLKVIWLGILFYQNTFSFMKIF